MRRSWYWRLAVLVLVLFGLWATPAFGATFTVTSTADSGAGSLRQAILDANGSANDGNDVIAFAIPGPAIAPYSIALATALPDITEAVTIDGTSQPGWIGPPIVELDGSDVTSGYGLHLAPGSGGSIIKGLVIGGFHSAGIEIESGGNTISNNYVGTGPTGGIPHGNTHGVAIESGQNNTVGGASPADRNVISGNNNDGVFVGPGVDGSSDLNVIRGNFIGTDASGASALGNTGHGVTLYSSSNSIADNVISASAPDIWILGPGSSGSGANNTITGNTIGLSADGKSPLVGTGAVGGILLTTGAHDNVIGGTTAPDRNVISGTGGIGVALADAATTNNVVEGNWIGTDGAGGLSAVIASQNGTGVLITDASQNTIGGTVAGAGNVIAHNRGTAGIAVGGSGVGDAIQGNQIFDNTGLGIDLASDGLTANDAGDGDSGPNNLQNFPVITGFSESTMSGTLASPDGDYTIEVYTNAACDASGNGEGKTLLGSQSVPVTSGHWSLALEGGFEAGGATATATSATGDTSEFSACFGATAPDGSGTLTTPTASVIAGTSGHTLVFTYTAATGGMSGGEVTLAVPSGWDAPSTTGTDPGYTIASKGTVSVAGSTIDVTGLTLAGGGTFTITYGSGSGATAPSTIGSQTWQAQQHSSASGPLTNLASSPSIAVNAAPDGSGALTIPFTTATAGSTGNTLTFTYTAITGGMSDGAVTVAVPAGWSAPSTTGTDPGYTTSTAGTVSVSGSTIGVTGVTLAAGGTFTISYGAKTGGGTGATAPSTAGSQTWQAQQRSTAGGTLTKIPSPSVAVTVASSTGDSLTLGTATGVGVGDPVEVTGNSLHLNALPGKADIEIAIDTTGSMGPSITQAKADATNLVTAVRNSIPDASFAVVQFRDAGDSPEYQVVQALTDTAPDVQSAINGLSAGGGGDNPEAYNTVFRNSYSPALGGAIGWRTGSRKFVIVIGDAEPHAAGTAGISGCADTIADPHGYNTATELAGMKTNERTLFMLRQVATTTTTSLVCYQSLAAGAYTGGQGVDGGTSLGAQIVGLVQEAASHVGTIAFSTNRAGVAFDSETSLVPVTTPATMPFTGLLTVDGTIPAGGFDVTVTASADGAPRASATLHVVVPLSNLSVSASPTSVGAGIDQVKLGDIPNAWLAFYAGSTLGAPVGSTPVGSTPVGSTPIGSTPVGSTPVGSTPVGSTPVASTPVGSTPVGSTGLFDMPVASTPVGSTALASVLLSQINLTGTTWDQILCAPLAGKVLTSLTLGDLKNGICSSTQTSLDRFKALSLKQVDLTTTLLKSVHWSTLLMGNTPLSSLAGGFSAWCDPVTGLIPENGGSCANATGATTVLQMDVAGQLGSAPVGSTPVGSTPVGSTPVGSTPVGSTPVASTAVTASKLATIPLSTISPTTGIIDCTKVSCTTNKTLGDAYQANAIVPTATFSAPALVAAMNTAGITVNDLLIAILGSAGFPWETLPVQGLQPYSLTQPHVTYTVSTTVNCSALSTFTLGARLPDGFFPVNNTAKLSLNGGRSKTVGAPDVVIDSVIDSPILSFDTLPSFVESEAVVTAGPLYRWTLGCGGITGSTTAVLTFDSFVGLRLGAFTTDVVASTVSGDVAIGASGAPVKVGQNGEPANDTPGTAATIAPNTLVVGHIGSNGDQDFYQVNLTGLPRGTKVSVFLNVPADSDFDLTVSKPAAPSFFSSPVGSTPIASTPIEDRGVGFSTTGQAVPSETLQDIPVGSTPVGSTPVGSTPVGSTSTNRGDVNEAAQIITAGESGVATIGVSGYNGASSGRPYVLRVQETPPPPLPANCPARSISVKSTDQGTLPSTLSATTKSLFLLNKQRLTAMYGKTAVANLLSALNTLAARPEVSGSVLAVDGNTAVRNAYAAWDAKPCDVTAANNVVRAVNDVAASYRSAGLPNLHYIVLLGTDEAIPMARTPDPVTLSPEENAAADLAFTTNGLTVGNALYSSAAENNILTDGAYGAFTRIPWLGHDLLLPQVSVSRLVETPTDMLGQINRYLGLNGISAPQTAAGTLSPSSGLVTGYDFLADGATTVAANLTLRFGFVSPDTFAGSGRKKINNPGSGDAPWTAGDITSAFLGAANPADVASINGHYNHYELEAADTSLATSSQVTAAAQARILFTMGCHGGLNVADTLGGSGGKYLDWAQLWATKQAAMYIANSGFGYGDSASNALSERLLSLYAKNLRSDTTTSVGEQWVAALQQYFATAGVYDVYDEKVMEEMTFYGLPFWHFGGSVAPPPYTPPAPLTSNDPAPGVQSAPATFSGPDATTQSQFGLYRPILPVTTKEVTPASPTPPARGVWITSLATTDTGDIAPTMGMPTIDLAKNEPKPKILPIFFPASPFSLTHSNLFGKQRDYVNVSDQFRPDPLAPTLGRQRQVTHADLTIFYSNSTDVIPPLVSQVNVSFTGTSATVTARVTDNLGNVVRVAALVHTNSGWLYVPLTKSDPATWTATGISTTIDPEVFVEATDGPNVAYSANKGSNFTSTSNTDTIRMSFGGFLPPIQNPPSLNIVKAGSSVPIKFNLGGNLGLDVFATDFPKSQQIDCQTLVPFGPISTDTSGQSSLSYTASTDQYTYSWKTDPGWVGMCRTLIVQFKDGSQGVADFQLTK